jgi:hypothetical protein
VGKAWFALALWRHPNALYGTKACTFRR